MVSWWLQMCWCQVCTLSSVTTMLFQSRSFIVGFAITVITPHTMSMIYQSMAILPQHANNNGPIDHSHSRRCLHTRNKNSIGFWINFNWPGNWFNTKLSSDHKIQVYIQTSNISCTLVGNEIVDHSDVVRCLHAYTYIYIYIWRTQMNCYITVTL